MRIVRFVGSEYEEGRSKWAIRNDSGKFRVYDFVGQDEGIDAYFVRTDKPNWYHYHCYFEQENATAEASAQLIER